MRDALKDTAYFDKWIDFYIDDIEHKKRVAKEPGGDELYRPQFVFDISQHYLSLLLQRYSRGDAVQDLAQYIEPILHYREEAERLAKTVWSGKQQDARHDWKMLNVYVDDFWLLGLALAFDVRGSQWKRLIALIGNEGNDALLDRVIASREHGRPLGEKLCHPKPYKRLLDAINAPREEQAERLRTFVDKWYRELDRAGRKDLHGVYERPYWYKYDTLKGGYFGYWCIEAVAAVKAFGLDDSLCLGHPHYPGDLLRANERTTHRSPPRAPAPTTSSDVPAQAKDSTGWLARLLRRG